MCFILCELNYNRVQIGKPLSHMRVRCHKARFVAVQAVMEEFSDIRIAFGESDEYSFVFNKKTNVYGTNVLEHMCVDKLLPFQKRIRLFDFPIVLALFF